MEELTTKQKGAIAEVAIARDLLQRGYTVATPFGDYGDWDLLVERKIDSQKEVFQRVQVKYATMKNGCIPVRNRCHSVNAGRVRRSHLYNDRVEWVAVYEPSNCQCYYIPSEELRGEAMSLRVDQPKIQKLETIRWAKDYQSI